MGWRMETVELVWEGGASSGLISRSIGLLAIILVGLCYSIRAIDLLSLLLAIELQFSNISFFNPATIHH